MSYDSSDPKQIREAAKRAKTAERHRQEMVKAVMGLPQGREWVWGLLSLAGVFRNPFDRSALVTSFNAGQMNVGQMILADVMAACPDQYLVMMKEHQDGGRASELSTESGPNGVTRYEPSPDGGDAARAALGDEAGGA